MKRSVKLVLIFIGDILFSGVCLIVFALFHHVIQRNYESEDIKIESTENISTCENNKNEDQGIFACTCKTEAVSNDDKYVSENVAITIEHINEPNLIYHIADIHIKNIESFQTVFANDTFGKNYAEWPTAIDKKSNAIITINGDYYGLTNTGVVIRNGVLYRSTKNTADIAVLYRNGEFKTYRSKDFDVNKAVEEGAYQAWNFGPLLLDNGNAQTSFPTSTVIPKNPRTAIGYYEPGHYVFVNVEGRTATSKGMTLPELSSLFAKLGCKTAYNLDGGQSAMMVFNDKYVNNLCEDGRTISDAIIIKEVEKNEEVSENNNN